MIGRTLPRRTPADPLEPFLVPPILRVLGRVKEVAGYPSPSQSSGGQAPFTRYTEGSGPVKVKTNLLIFFTDFP
jgi:hypothetical protein